MGLVRNRLRRLNAKLGTVTGYQVTRIPRADAKDGKSQAKPLDTPTEAPEKPRFRAPADPRIDRLLRQPIFIMSPPRSGSTLLRLILGRHSRLHSQHETHFRRLEVGQKTALCRAAMREFDLTRADLEHLLWDRLLHWSMTTAGKERVVEKTPSNAFAWKRIATCWPDAQYVFLLRHPLAIARSWQLKAWTERTDEEAVESALSYMLATERARTGLPGYTVRYEELTDDPETVVKDICSFLDLDFEPGMLDYGADELALPTHEHLGDQTGKIRSGRVQPAGGLPDPAEVPESLREICRAWGYG